MLSFFCGQSSYVGLCSLNQIAFNCPFRAPQHTEVWSWQVWYLNCILVGLCSKFTNYKHTFTSNSLNQHGMFNGLSVFSQLFAFICTPKSLMSREDQLLKWKSGICLPYLEDNMHTLWFTNCCGSTVNFLLLFRMILLLLLSTVNK